MKPVIIGAGLAGLTAALSLAPMPVIVVSPYKLGDECASAWAQGGIAAAVGADDVAMLHAEDTLAAGAGLSDPVVTAAVTGDGIKIIDELLAHGVAFDRDAEGQLRLGLEAAHGRRRIVHAADATGAAVMKSLIAAVRATPSIEVIEGAMATELFVDDGAIIGVQIAHDGNNIVLPTRQVVMATGGVGALWKETSNPLGSWGRGLWLAAKAGAVLGDLEFMQFHPTCIAIGLDPMPLASEALRGEGCTLIDEQGERFTEELQPRDIVARAIFAKRSAGHRVFLDGRKALGPNFAKRFPAIYAVCVAAGIDPATAPIPVSTGAHYHMGGIVTDLRGRSNVAGLWACGEVANTGLHGANRLASNSLLEAASFGRRVAEDIKGIVTISAVKEPAAKQPRADDDSLTPQIRSIMSRHIGVLRNASGLQQAVEALTPLAARSARAEIGLMIAVAALRRSESRGGHARTDFPALDPKWLHRQTITLADMHTPKMRQPIANGA